MNGYTVIRGIARAFIKLCYFAEYKGRENEPNEGGVVVIANHSSFLDPLCVAAVMKRPVYFMGKSDLLSFKPMQWIFKWCNVVPVNRGESDIAALRKTFDIVNSGNMTGVFPQGTRIQCDSPDPESALAGIGLMALKTKAPFLPVAICYGKKHKRPLIFRKVKVVVGKPIPYEEYMSISEDKPNSHEISKYAFNKVCELFAENNNG